MKKFKLFLICCLTFLTITTQLTYGKEVKSTTSSIESVSGTTKPETLEANTDKKQTYAKVRQGEKLKPADFKECIEKRHHLNIKTINFSDNQRANTSNSGLYKIGLTFKTTDGKEYVGKFPYLIENQQATLFLDNVAYNTVKKRVSFKVSEKTANVFMFANDQFYTFVPDNNGFFEGKYNPNTLPKTLQFIALDDEGNYSDEHIIFLDNNFDPEKFEFISYQQNDLLIQGVSTSIDRIKSETATQEKAIMTPDAKGAFSAAYIDEPKTIKLNIDNKENLEFTPLKRNNQTINQLKENDNQLDPLREHRTKQTIIFLIIIIGVGTISLVIRHFLSARRQN